MAVLTFNRIEHVGFGCCFGKEVIEESPVNYKIKAGHYLLYFDYASCHNIEFVSLDRWELNDCIYIHHVPKHPKRSTE
jgi:hypothetical protein